MKKKYIQLGAVALILIALIGALVFLRSVPDVSETETDAESEIIYIYGDVSTEDIAPSQIDIHNEYGDYIIDNVTPEGALPAAVELTVRGWEHLSLDDYSLRQASANAKAMRAKDVIAENATAEDIKTFGFDSPRASVTVRFPNGDTQVLLFGENAPGGEGVYVMLQHGNTIYLISDSTALPYFKPDVAYVNKTITATDPEFKGFNKVTLSGTNYPETIVIERTPENEVAAAGITLNTHMITAPIQRGIDTQKGLEPLASVYGLLANDVVAVDDSDETLEKYGLKDPAVIISVVGDTPEMTFTLRISETAENGEVRLIKDGSKVIYELSPTALPFLQYSLFDMMNKMVVVPNIKNVDKVVFLTHEKRKYEFVLKHGDDGQSLDVTLDGKPLPDVVDEEGKTVTGGENFRKLYQTMIVCSYSEPMPKLTTSWGTAHETTEEVASEAGAETEAGTDAVPEAEASEVDEAATGADELVPNFIASIEYVYNNGMKSDTVALYSGPPRKIVIEFNGERGYYGQSIYADRLLEDVEKVINGIAVKTYL